MYTYRKEHLLNYFNKILQRTINEEALNWMAEKTFQIIDGDTSSFYSAFTAVPRKTGKELISVSQEGQELITDILPGFTLEGYPADRLARLVLLLNWPSDNKENYTSTISQLFKAAEMNELVALYGALPLLAYPEEWIEQCKDGIRSNIGSVLEAIICNNPYPAQYLPEPAWNQLVLKAFFTEKNIGTIEGIDRRANQALAYALSDYANERWAAGRTFDLRLWRVIAKFIDERVFPVVQKGLITGGTYEKCAAYIACSRSNYPPARAVEQETPALKNVMQLLRPNLSTEWGWIFDILKEHTDNGTKI